MAAVCLSVCARAVASLEEAEGHQHLAGGHGGGYEQNVSHSTAGVRGSRPPEFFLYIFNTKSYILMHSLAPKIGITSVLSRPLCIGEMKTVGRGCRMRPERPKIEGEGRERGGVLGEGAASPTSSEAWQ